MSVLTRPAISLLPYVVVLCLTLALSNGCSAAETATAADRTTQAFLSRHEAETLIGERAPERLWMWKSAVSRATNAGLTSQSTIGERQYSRVAIERFIERNQPTDGDSIDRRYESGGAADSPGQPVSTAVNLARHEMESQPTDEENRLLHLASLAGDKHRAVAIMIDTQNTSPCGEQLSHTCIQTTSLPDYLANTNERACPDIEDRNFSLVPKVERNICTAFRITDNYIATAKHCIGKTTQRLWEVLDGYVFVFGFTGDTVEFNDSTIVRGTDVQHAIYSDTQDWLLLDISAVASSLTADSVTLPNNSISIDETSRFYQLGHPLGRELFIDDGPLLSTDADHLYYIADSYSGYSGAPVFSNDTFAGIFVGGPAVLDLYQDPIAGCTKPFICCRDLSDEDCVTRIQSIESNTAEMNQLAESELQCLSGARAIRSSQFESCLRDKTSCEHFVKHRSAINARGGH